MEGRIESVMCPLVDTSIEDIDCIENRDIVDGNLVEDGMPEKYKSKTDWKQICQLCKNHKI